MCRTIAFIYYNRHLCIQLYIYTNIVIERHLTSLNNIMNTKENSHGVCNLCIQNSIIIKISFFNNTSNKTLSIIFGNYFFDYCLGDAMGQPFFRKIMWLI